jgi:copper chaperone CopZ
MLKDIFHNGAAAFEVGLVHHVPGRLRLRSAALKGDARAGEEIKERLAAIAGIRSLTVNPKTGSLLLEYDPAVIAPERIVGLLASRGFTFSTAATESEAAPRLVDQIVSAIKGWAFDALAEHLALAIIGAVA